MQINPEPEGHGDGSLFGDFGLPTKTDMDVQVFNANTFVDQKGLQKWSKPRRASMHYMICLGPGAGGGGGGSGTSVQARGGGGGGSSGSLAKLFIPSILVPDELYIQVPDGGQGGSPANFGTNGLQAWIGFNNKSKAATSPMGVLLISDNNGPSTGGSPGGVGSAGAGGGAGTVAQNTGWATWGIHSANVGIAGTGAGSQTGADGVNQTSFGTGNSLQVTGGCGGGGCTSANFNGGSVAISGGLDWGMGINYPSTSSVPGGTPTTLHGSPGIKRIHPFINTGGGGGAALFSAVGGNGGNGGYGCGGGGGGAGTTGGRGGNGGPGLVIIYSW